MLDEKGFEERVRLLLLDNPRPKVTSDVNAWPRKWPSYIAGAVWWAFFFTSIVAILVLLFMVIFAKYEEQTMLKRPIYLTRYMDPIITADRSAKLPKDSILSSMLQSSSNAFFVTGKILDWKSSCSLESLLKHASDKNVFLVTFVRGAKDGRFEKRLRSEYSNLMMLKADGEQFFKGTMFEGDWRGDANSMKDAELLTIWQFGGTVMADDVVITSELPKNRGNGNCLVSPDVISCPSQCSAFLYQLLLNAKESPGSSMKTLVESSVMDFCGNPAVCPGVQRLQPTCSKPDDGCFLFKLPREETPSNQTWSLLSHHCPVTYATSQSRAHNL
ncbi:hypothetical protein GE061_007733 [Apolygus lucorum]|uniref:Uncharacterized protein n=1 Tax=Apolygus lucorum TaxID=248454 RepID=A0A8S9WPC5_APOLU|nr:hypothetical protein GE061_007733 [Apolygus lucorum]